MQNIRNAGVDELQAICGGCALLRDLPRLRREPSRRRRAPPKSLDEEDLLDASDHVEANSRLSCQLVFGPDLDGVRVTVAPED